MLQSWAVDVVQEAPGCPDFVAEEAVLRAAQVFLRETRAWIVEAARFHGRGARHVDLTLPDHAMVVSLESVTVDGVSEHHIMEGARSVLLHEPVTGLVAVTVALMPESAACDLPLDLQLWREGIISGAKARLQGMAGKSWEDQASAARHREAFERDMVAARAHLVTRSAVPLRTAVQPFI